MIKKIIICLLGIYYFSASLQAQESIQKDGVINGLNNFIEVPDKLLVAIKKKYTQLSKQVSKQTAQTLQSMQLGEQKVYKKIRKTDPTLTEYLLKASTEAYQVLPSQLEQLGANKVNQLRNYMPGIDSLQTMLGFIGGTATINNKNLKLAQAAVQNFQQHMQVATATKAFLKNRKEQLQLLLKGTQMVQLLTKINKEVFYFQQQLNEYCLLVKDQEKLHRLVLEKLADIHAFKDFFAQNSQLASMFRLTGSNTITGNEATITGLQTRQQIGALLQNNFQPTGMNPQQFVQARVQGASGELQAIKNKLNNTIGGNGSTDMPDFKPNTQKTKSFLQRIEFGFNMQSLRPNGLLPVTSDLALMVGYKLSGESILGVGVSYKMGWGNGLNTVRISHEGFGLRIFMDWKLKGDFFVSGGYEQNYMESFNRLSELRNQPLSAWKSSGIVGITKKYKLGKKTGNIQVLYDFLHLSNHIKTQPIIFRTGFNF